MRCFYKLHALLMPLLFRNKGISAIHKNGLLLITLFLSIFANQGLSQTTLGGVNLGNLPNYLFVFTDGRNDANWQSASKGYIGDVAIDGIQAVEKTSGSFPYSGRIYTNAATLSAWATIISNNSSQASGITGETSRITGLTTNLESVFTQVNALTATTGYENRSATSLNGLNTQNSISETFVINVRSGFSVSSKINITGDAGDIFILRWDSDANFGDGYEGQVKFQSGGAIVPLGGLKPTNFIHVAGEIASSGGGSNPAAPYPQGPRLNDGTGALITGATDFNGGGFFTGYWFTTGKPDKTDSGQPYGDQTSLSNAIFVGGWYSKNTKFSMTSGTSGVYVSPPTSSGCAAPTPTAQNTTITSGTATTLTAIGCNATYPLKWYSDAALTNEITVGVSGNNFTTPVLTTTIDYYAACVKDASCKSGAKVTVTVTPPPGTVFSQCWVSPTKPTIVNAKTEWTINQAAGTATIRTTFAKTFVDNTYGSNAISWPNGHKFGDLTGSDKLQLSLKDAGGMEKMNVTLDYISASSTVTSGYTTLGVSGGEGKMNVGSAADVVGVKTSISENFNNFGYVLTTNSPATNANYAPNPLYPNWIYDVWYEVTVKLSAFGAAGFGEPVIQEVHASPSKTGNNTEVVIPEVCPKFDLALDKKVKSGQPSVFAPGDNVTFTITVYNQGNAAASNIVVTDYIPFGLSLNDPNWTSPFSNKTTRTIPSLAVGASTSVDITFKIEAGTNGTIINKAEISAASGGTDDDSTPDNTDGNQPGETGSQLKDNVINENGKTGGDEDDHDIAPITVDNSITRFDLALRKKPTAGQSVNVKAGDIVSFTIEVFNQGTEDATDVVITDYIPTNLTLEDGNWTTPVSGKTTYTVPFIAAGASVPAEIIFKVNTSPGTSIVNKAEISEATGGSDIDSTPDATDGNQPGETGNQLINDSIDQNGNNGGDEDDHDLATLTTCDLPLGGSDLVVFPPSTSADLPNAQAGQSWVLLSQPAGANATITTPAGIVSGMTVNGVYRFVLNGTAGCNDTVSISRAPSTSGDGELCWISPTKPNIVSAKMTWDVDPVAGTVKIRTTFARTFVDNTYGTSAIGWPSGHTFGNLTGSDHLQLALFDGTGAKKLEFKIDYITSSSAAPSGYKTLGVTGGDGGMITGSATDVVGALTAMDVNFNQLGYVLTTNSPLTDADYTANPTYPNWIYDVWYEVTVKLSAFGAAGFGQPYITGIHASPSKTGSNTEIVIPGSCPVAFAEANNVCEGGTINLLASSAPSGSTFTWSGPNGFFSTEQSPVITNAELADAGVYTLTTKLNQNFATDTVSVKVFPKLSSFTATSNSNLICIGNSDTLKLFANTTDTGVTYAWTGPNSFVSSAQNPIILNPTALNNGEYTLTITRNGCTAVSKVTVSLIACPVGSLGDFVWNDLDNDGRQDNGEPGVDGVKVILWSATAGGQPLAKLDSTTTAGGGKYLFDNLDKGNYLVQFIASTFPAGLKLSTKPNAAGVPDDLDSDANPTTGISQAVTIDPSLSGLSKDNPTIDAGLYTPICVSSNLEVKVVLNPTTIKSEKDIVSITYIVKNNGQEPLTAPIFQAQYQIFNRPNQTGTPLTATRLNDAGNDNILSPDEIWIYTATKPGILFSPGTVFIVTGTMQALCNDNKIQAGGGTLLYTAGVNIDVEIQTPCFVPGDTIDVHLVTRLLVDEDAALNPGTIVIGGTTITLPKRRFEARNLRIATPFLNGGAEFDPFNLPAGVNLTVLDDQGGVDAGRNANNILDESEPINTYREPCTAMGQDDVGCEFPDWVFHLRIPIPANYTGNNFVITATDKFDLFEAIENPIGSNTFDAFITLGEAGGADSDSSLFNNINVTAVATSATCPPTSSVANNDGKITLTGFVAPERYAYNAGTTYTGTATYATATAIPANGIIVSNLPNPTATTTYTIRIFNAQGCYKDLQVILQPTNCLKGSIGDFVWKDLNDNGQQDSGEPGVDGVKVILWSADANSQPLAKLDSTVTASGGKYTFTNLAKGDYIVQIVTSTLPSSYLISNKKDVGNDVTDNDFTTAGLSSVVKLDPALGGLSKDNPTIDGALISPCPTITSNGDSRDTLCSGYYGEFFGVTYANIGNNDIKFVMFTTPQSGSSMYTGGTVLSGSFSGNGAAQWPVGIPGSQFPANNGTTPVNYYVYAILTNTPTDANCRPSVEKVYTVLPLPKFTAAAQPVCEGSSTFDVKVTIQMPGTFKITLARGFATIGNGPIPQDIIKTQTGTAGNGATTTLSVPISDTTGVVVIVQDEATGCASAGSSGKPIVSKKPKWTLSTLPVCSADKQTYSVTFTVTGKNGTIKVDKGTLSGTNPYTVTGVPTGATLKLTDSLSAICKFDTLLTGPNCSCTPISPKILTPSFTVCKGDSFPSMKATVDGLAQVEWFTTLTGGSPVFIGNNYKPAGIANADTAFYAQAKITDTSCLAAVSTPRVTSTINVQDCSQQIDLALKKLINKKIAKIGDILTYTIKVWNESVNNATKVEVTDSIAATVQFQAGTFVASRGSASISGNVIKWTIGSIAANGDTVTLTYQVKATQEGVHFNTAQICKAYEKDIDSTPCNNDEEDDNDRECFTVPFKLCPGEKVEVTIESTFTNVKWFKGGIEIPALAGQSVILLNETGSYTYTATNKTCPAEGCCPIIIQPGDNCCPDNLCIPFTIQKTKKAGKPI